MAPRPHTDMILSIVPSANSPWVALLYLIAAGNEVYARLTGKPVLLSWAVARSMAREAGRTRFDPGKSQRELGLTFRPVAETLADEVAWFRKNGVLTAG